MIDVSQVRSELLAKRFRIGEAPRHSSGIYAFFLIDPSSLTPLTSAQGGLLYVGMTCPEKTRSVRDHIECSHSGGSTVRRSLGALLRDNLQPPLKPIPRALRLDPKNWQNYRFQDEGEVALTRWMKAHLQMTFVRLDETRRDMKECEQSLIGELGPPLNLTDWPNPQAVEIERLRGQCAQQARANLLSTGPIPSTRD
jgi:hypothetical protein